MYEVPDSKKSIDQNRWPFKVGGKEFWIPRAKYLTTRQADTMQEDSLGEALSKIAPNKATADVLLDMPLDHVEGLFEAWQEDSGVTLGESESSES